MGRASPSSTASRRATEAPAAPLLRDVQLTSMMCTGGAGIRKPLGPVLRERRQRLHGRRHREGRLRRRRTAAERRHHEEAEPGRHLCGGRLERRGSLLAEHEREHLDLDRNHVGSSGRRPAGAHAQLEGQDLRDQLQQSQSAGASAPPPCRTRRTTTPARSATSSSRRRGRTARRPARPGRSRRCELDSARQLLLLGRRGPGSAAGAEAVEQPQHRPALREQVHAQGRYRDRQPQRVAPLRLRAGR